MPSKPKFNIIILGCGASSGVPQSNGNWGKCNPHNHKNIRQRSSILIKYNNKNVLIDTTPDLRNQMLVNSISHIDSVLYTHHHADHTLGIHDLNWMGKKIFSNQGDNQDNINSTNVITHIKNNSSHTSEEKFYQHTEKLDAYQKIDMYASKSTWEIILRQYPYFFYKKDVENILTPPIESFAQYSNKSAFCPNIIGNKFTLYDEEICCINQDHFSCISTGFRFENFAYCTDVFEFFEQDEQYLYNLDLWIISCTNFFYANKKHASFEKIMQWKEKFLPKRMVFTHMGIDMDYENVSKILPNNVEMAFDNMIINI